MYMRSAAIFASLDWRAFNGSVAAIHTTITRQWLKPGMTLFTGIKIHAGVNRHCFCFPVPAIRAGQCRFQLNCLTIVCCAGAAGSVHFIPPVVPDRCDKKREHAGIKKPGPIIAVVKVVCIKNEERASNRNQQRIHTPVLPVGNIKPSNRKQNHRLEDPHGPSSEQLKASKAKCRSYKRKNRKTTGRKYCSQKKSGCS